ncbi:hypothetical protein EEPDABAO_00069 [Klebsiella phage mfs]|uniref:Uncharacterized protein n=1 Tax=Klebsiella phage mfs TaxID=2985561 RepID=A0A9X9JWK7_9CAUD|nr:hypothetical protein EEPDABAO_00069 [Klebsiella phage mfs]
MIASDNVDFKPPASGEYAILNFHTSKRIPDLLDLSRKCRVYLGLVQVDVIFKPGTGTDAARLIAQNVAKYFPEGKILGDDKLDLYVSEWAEVYGVQKARNRLVLPRSLYGKM